MCDDEALGGADSVEYWGIENKNQSQDVWEKREQKEVCATTWNYQEDKMIQKGLHEDRYKQSLANG